VDQCVVVAVIKMIDDGFAFIIFGADAAVIQFQRAIRLD